MSDISKVTKNGLYDFLLTNKDSEYLKLQNNILPNNNCEVIGVRMPVLHSLALKFSTNIDDFLEYEACYHEEKVIVLLSIVYSKKAFENKVKLIYEKIELIDSWYICDTLCSAFKDFRTNQEKGWFYIEKGLDMEYAYANRFAIVNMLFHYLNDKYIDKVLEKMLKIKSENYYVKMAVAWLLSMSYFKYKDKTKITILKVEDDFISRKTISKIKESRKYNKEIDNDFLLFKHR